MRPENNPSQDEKVKEWDDKIELLKAQISRDQALLEESKLSESQHQVVRLRLTSCQARITEITEHKKEHQEFWTQWESVPLSLQH